MTGFRKALFILVSISLFFLPVFFYSAPLPVDEAFKLNIERVSNGKIKAQWDIVKGYHLYKGGMSILLGKDNETILGTIVYPKGIREHSSVLGYYDVYRDKVIVDIPVLQLGNGNTDLIIKYQGCKDSSSCYPPVSKVFSISPPSSPVNHCSDPTLSSAQELLEGGSIIIILVSFFVFGIFLSLTPCVLPMIPILIGIIIGQKDVKTFKAFTLSITYVFGVAVTYTIAGVITAILGNSIQSLLQNFWVILACSLIFVLLSLSLFGLYELELPSSIMNKLNNVSCKTKGGSYIWVFLMGAISSLVVSPCVSAPLVGALIYIASTGNLVLGGSALFSFSLGMGVLLVIAGVTGGKLFLKAGLWMVAVRYFLGVLMLVVAVLLLSRVIPKIVTDIFWAVLLISVGFYMGALEPVKEGSTWLKFRKFIALLIMLFGITVFFSLFLTGQVIQTAGDTYEKATAKILSQTADKDSIFNVVTTPEKLQKFIDRAIKEQKPVMIDYYADWCTSCKEVDGTTFKDPDVRHLLKSFVVVRADITKNDENSTALKKKYNVFAPPHVVFLDNKGNEIKQAAIAGEASAKELLEQMNIITSLY